MTDHSRAFRLSLSAGAALAGLCVAPSAWAEKYAAIVIDTQTHEVLHADAADDLRYPASLTKMMTLYMLFDAIDRGEISTGDRMVVSRHAAVQAPTKLGLRTGKSIRVEDAIRAVVTKSANDAAVVIAERLGGTESNFAAKMTARARSLGMLNTTFVNASGLPDLRQRTTARDMAILGERIFQDHQKYYYYFQTPGMQWGRQYARNHNNLLGRVNGVDGIKTGYTNASGYNLASSVTRDGRRLVAVVMGGATAASRDAQVAQLIEDAYAELAERNGGVLLASASNAATLTSMPLNRVTVGVNGTIASQYTGADQAGYTTNVPSVTQAIAGAAAAAAAVLAPDAAAATPRPTAHAGAPIGVGGGGGSEFDTTGLY